LTERQPHWCHRNFFEYDTGVSCTEIFKRNNGIRLHFSSYRLYCLVLCVSIYLSLVIPIHCNLTGCPQLRCVVNAVACSTFTTGKREITTRRLCRELNRALRTRPRCRGPRFDRAEIRFRIWSRCRVQLTSRSGTTSVK